eukprot:2715743-Pleurochrysis_carterae.AAC.1
MHDSRAAARQTYSGIVTRSSQIASISALRPRRSLPKTMAQRCDDGAAQNSRQRASAGRVELTGKEEQSSEGARERGRQGASEGGRWLRAGGQVDR